MHDPYLIWSHEHGEWWGPGGCGYTRSMARAGRYSREEALCICAKSSPGTSTRMGALPELPVRLADVEAMVAAYDEVFRQTGEAWR